MIEEKVGSKPKIYPVSETLQLIIVSSVSTPGWHVLPRTNSYSSSEQMKA